MRTNSININFWIRSSRTSNKYGTIQNRVTVNGQRLEFGSTGTEINRKDWSQAEQRIKGTSFLVEQQNLFLANIKGRIMAIYNQYEINQERLSVHKLRTLFNGKKTRYSLQELLEIYLEDNPQLNQKTVNGYKRRFSKVFNFNKEVLPEEIDAVFMYNYDKFLVNKLKYGKSYAYKCKASIKMVLDHAVKSGLLDSSQIFHHSISREVEYNTSHLSKDELETLTNFKFDIPELEKATDAYLFCCYTGLSWIDYFNFDRTQIETVEGVDYIKGKRQKTNSKYYIRIFAEAKALLEKYNYNLPKGHNQGFNKAIKISIPLAGIDKKMKFHSSRKTFANMCINDLLISKDTTAAMMGQKDTKELDAYANSTEMRVINELSEMAA